jgi:uncharacterized repeat protein (TIGR01451 family)
VVTVTNPLPAGVTQLTNTAGVSDDGSNGADLIPGNNVASDSTPVSGAPDLRLSKTDGGVSAQPGAVVTYTLTYANVGNQDATGVVLTETVPANTSYTGGPEWSCNGSTCTHNVGAVAGSGGGGSVIFVVAIDNPLPEGVTQVDNTASVGDDGANGADPTLGNNVASITTNAQKRTFLPIIIENR